MQCDVGEEVERELPSHENKNKDIDIDKDLTISLSNDDKIDSIDELTVLNSNYFSEKCRELLPIGLDGMYNDFKIGNTTIKFIDLFSGLGGMRIGFEQALEEFGLKGQCVFSSDIKPAAIKVYEANFKHNPKSDITKVDPSTIPNFDFLLAGFPCQAFSQAGLGLGFQDTRGTLFFDVAKILLEKKPLGFILENVEGLVTHDKGKTFRVIINTLQELGYNVEYKILNGKDFGLAQSRNRIYIVGYKNSVIENLDNFTPKYATLSDIIDNNVPPKKSIFADKLLAHYGITEVYGKAIKDKRGGDNNIHSWDIGLKGDISSEQRELLERLLKQRRNKKWADIIGIEWMDGMPLSIEMISTFYESPNLQEMLDDLVNKGYIVFEYPKKKVENKRVYDETLKKGYNIVTGKLSFEYTKILSPFDITPTIVATDVSKLAVPVNDGIRNLTVKEGLRLFGFPEHYDLSSIKEKEVFDLLGNTVCVPVIKSVSKKLISAHINWLEGNY